MALFLLVLPKPAPARRTNLLVRWPSGRQAEEVRCANRPSTWHPPDDVPTWLADGCEHTLICGDGIRATSLGGSTLYQLNPYRHEEERRRHLPHLQGVRFLLCRGTVESAKLAAAAADASYARDDIFRFEALHAQGTHPSAEPYALFHQFAEEVVASASSLLGVQV